MAQLVIVRQTLDAAGPGTTTIDRGKALHKIMVQAITKLQPDGVPPKPHALPPREWHQFIVLYDSYVLDELNRHTISKLYIGEGTFNRTRPSAGWPRSSGGLLCLLEGEDAMADVDTAPGCDRQVALDDARHSSPGQDAGKQGLWLRP